MYFFIISTKILIRIDGTSNNASASMIIREILARLVDSSAVKKESHEHVPSRWRPDEHKSLSLPPS